MRLIPGLLGCIIAASAANAAEIDFSTVIRDLDGAPVKMCADETPACKAGATIGMIAAGALLAPDDPHSPQAPAEKVRCFTLALSVHKGGRIDVSAEDVVLIKGRIAAAYGPLIVGRAFEILDPAPDAKTIK
jgi:hypothetical protein